MVQGVENRAQSSLSRTHVHGDKARCAAQQSGPTGRGGQRNQVLPRGVGAAVVGHRYLHADDGRDHHDILLHVAGDGGGRIAVGAGQAVGGDTLLRESPGLGHQILHAAGHAIGAQQAHHGGDAAGGERAQPGLRHPGGRALFSAAARDVDMQVDIAGNQELAGQVEHLHVREAVITVDPVVHAADFLPHDQEIFFAQGRRCVNPGVFQQFDHTVPSLSFPSSSLAMPKPV